MKLSMFMFVKCNGMPLSCHTERVDDPCILDLAFILDASGSIELAWPDVRRFVAGVVGLVNVSSAGTHVAVIKFGADSDIVFGFNDGQDRDAVIRRVLTLPGPIPFANTQIHKALNDANDKLFNEVTNTYAYRTDDNIRKVRQIWCYYSRSKPDQPRRSSGASLALDQKDSVACRSRLSLIWTQYDLDPIWSGSNLV